MSELERACRRLLRLFPVDHRRVYGEEMLGVMLDRAEEGQRRPGWGETVDLARTALWLRLGEARATVSSGRWREVAAVFGVIGALLLATENLRPLLADRLMHTAGVDGFTELAQAVGWMVAAVTVLIGWRVVAMAAAWVAVLGQAVWLWSESPNWQGDVVSTWWQWLLAITCAITLSVPATAGQGVRVLGVKRIAWLAGWSVVTAGSMLGRAELAQWRPGPWPWIGLVAAAALAGYVVVLLAVLSGLDGWTRRRVLVLLAPPTFMLVAAGMRFYFPVDGDVVILGAVPVLVLAVGLFVVHRHERRKHLLALGRQAELAGV